jgi:ATP-dependent RNA helicase RhlE
VLTHLIDQGNWSQVLVFTRTKYGANNVAEYLTKHGIKAMALHGNKSQSARTQALAEFKSGELRALVATDIAARGIDIDELPHVVNYEIPNVPEDYVHRIGRTGRAGASGQAVSLVCMDEEGFMHEIERFTKQQIPVEILEGFGPIEGEQAEPIAMGRQTLWGGLGRPPSRDVMQAAARAARQDMMQRIRDNKASQGPRGQSGRGTAPNSRRQPTRAEGDAPYVAQAGADGLDDSPSAAPRRSEQAGDGAGRNRRRRGRGTGGGSNPNGSSMGNGGGHNAKGPRSDGNGAHRHNPRPAPQATREFGFDDEDDRDLDNLPRNIDPLQTNLHGRRNAPRGPSHGAVGQPDPMRTSIDVMGKGGGGNRNKRNNNRGGGGGGRGNFGGGGNSGGGNRNRAGGYGR